MIACKDCFYVEDMIGIRKHMTKNSTRCMHPEMEVEDTMGNDWYNGNRVVSTGHFTIVKAREFETLCGSGARYFKEIGQ